MAEQNYTEKFEGQFRLHFFLGGQMHDMDAHVLHACEGSLLGILTEVAKQLDIELRVDTCAYGEGGLVVWLTLVGKHAVALGLISTVVASLCAGAAWLKYQPTLLRQQAELNEANLQKTRLEIKKLEQDFANEAQKGPATAATKPLELQHKRPEPEDVLPALHANRRVVKLRSQFYEALLPYERVEAVGFAPTHTPHEKQERVVRRERFSSFVVKLGELEPEVVRDAEIEIIAPILKRGAGKWRGIYLGHSISFDLEDEDFLGRVSAKKVRFQSGTTLKCTLKILMREGDSGIPEPVGYVVDKVDKHHNKGASNLLPASVLIHHAWRTADSANVSLPKPKERQMLLLTNDQDRTTK